MLQEIVTNNAEAKALCCDAELKAMVAGKGMVAIGILVWAVANLVVWGRAAYKLWNK